MISFGSSRRSSSSSWCRDTRRLNGWETFLMLGAARRVNAGGGVHASQDTIVAQIPLNVASTLWRMCRGTVLLLAITQYIWDRKVSRSRACAIGTILVQNPRLSIITGVE